MNKTFRKTALLLLLVAALALAWFSPEPGEQRSTAHDAVAPRPAAGTSSPAAASPAQAPGPSAIVAALPERAALGKPKHEMFGAQSWQPPPPKAATAPPPPPPVPPPNPFRFAGRLMQDGQTQIFLTRGDLPVPVKVGEVIDGIYRVDAINAETVVMTYLPLNHKQTIVLAFADDAGPGMSAITARPLALAPPSGTPPASASPSGPPPASSPPPSLPPLLGPARADPARISPAPAAPSAVRPRVAWHGPARVRAGASFSVALRVTSDQPISASPLQVRFDPALLEAVEVRPGRLFSANARGFNYSVGTGGSIVVGSGESGSSATGDLELLVLTFKPLKPGATAEVSLAALNLRGPAGRTLEHDTPGAFRATVVQ